MNTQSSFPTISALSDTWTLKDYWGAFKVRWGFGRSSYLITPGLYEVGTPSEEDPVFVTANYKLSVDHLRRALRGRNAWVLVLDTKGINVWCAAGKGTFGTEELIHRLQTTGLQDKEVCPHAVFGVQNGRVTLQDRDACMECGACAKNCPTSAIQVRAGVGCAYAVLASSWFRKRSQTDSCCMPADGLF